MQKVFRNPGDNRLRAGWRILLFIVMFWTMSAVILAIKPLLGDITKKEFLSNYSLIIVAVLATIATIAVIVARRYFDKKSITSLGLVRSKRAIIDVLFGFLLSGLMAAAFLLVAVKLGFVQIDDIRFSALKEFSLSGGYVETIKVISLVSMALLLLEHVLVGYWEELVFRGYLFQNMREGLGLILAIAVSCLMYGLLHAANPNATLLSSCIIMAFGFLRIYGYLLTNMLWLSIGMHIGWNFFQGPVFGFAASGHEHTALFELSLQGPEWLSGGSFGPEASVLILPVLVAALFVMKAWGHKSRVVYKTMNDNEDAKDYVIDMV